VAEAAPVDPLGSGVWVDLSGRVQIRASGKDCARFLNGMLTNDVASLAPGAYVATLLLDRKGHVLSEGLVIAAADAYLLDLSPGTGPAALEILQRHLIADDVELADRSGACSELAFEGAAGRRWLEQRGLPLPAAGRAAPGPGGLLLLGEGWLTPEGVRVLGPREALAPLAASGLPQLAGAQLERVRIERFVPLYGRDVGARCFPQEARLDAAVSYSKGCFLGQEIVARIRSRGAVNRFLVQLECAGPVAAEAAITAGGVSVGSVTSAAARPGGGALALGYVKRDHAAPGSELAVGGAPARVLGPPL
jgi:folate-binding protein YgfZ